MNETDQKEFVQLLAYLTGSKTEAELDTAIKTLGEENLASLTESYKKLKAATTEVEQKSIMDEMKSICEESLNPSTAKVTAKLGAKLNYLQALKNKCPEGTELYKAGGRVECKKCGGSTVKPVGKKRFQGGGEMSDAELAYNQRMAGARMADPRTRGTSDYPILLSGVSNGYIPQTGWTGPIEGAVMSIPGSYTITTESYAPVYGSKRDWYDFDPNTVGRMIISSPKFGNDTVYFTTPNDYIMNREGFHPVGSDEDQNKAKARFKEAETKANKAYKK